jgi:hypothetical protein
MKSFRVCMVLFLGLILLAQGCGTKTPEKPAATEDRNTHVISQLRTSLSTAAEELGRQKEENNVLAKEVTRLKGQIEALEEKAARQPEAAPGHPSLQPTPEPPADEGVSPKTRVGLMGAKAIAEFRAQQLSQRVDKLTKDLDNKEKELREIRSNEEKKQAEVARLSETLDRIQAQDKARSQEVTAKLSSMSTELAARTEDAKRFKGELEEKAAFLETLQQAVNDARKLKNHCENEVEKLRTELDARQAQLEKARGQLEDAVKEVQKYQVADEDMRRQLAYLQETGERSRRQAAQSEEESAQLKAELDKLTKRLQAVEAKGEQEPSTLERILEAPVPRTPGPEKQSLY